MKKNKLVELTLRQMLNYHLLNHCTQCGSKRIRVTIEELPEEMKKEIKDYKEESYFLYCDKCQEYSLVINYD